MGGDLSRDLGQDSRHDTVNARENHVFQHHFPDIHGRLTLGNPSENRHHRPNFNKISLNNPKSLDCLNFAKQNLL
jgi:hypothetical protein